MPSARHELESDDKAAEGGAVALDSLEEIISKLASRENEDGDIRAVRRAAQALLPGKKQEIRDMCVPWSVTVNEKKAPGK